MKTSELFENLSGRAAELTLDQTLKATIVFDLTGPDPDKWNGLIQNGRAELTRGGEPAGEPDITVTAESSTAVALFEKKLNPMMAFMTGKIKVKGDMSKVALIKSLMAGRK